MYVDEIPSSVEHVPLRFEELPVAHGQLALSYPSQGSISIAANHIDQR
jgi:hypothetical protein